MKKPNKLLLDINTIFTDPPDGVTVDTYPTYRPSQQLLDTLERLLVTDDNDSCWGELRIIKSFCKKKIPCRKKKSEYPHVIEGKDGLLPEPGYDWVNFSAKNDYRVVWRAGCAHSDIPHVITSEDEGFWVPEDGYEWNGSRSVVKAKDDDVFSIPNDGSIHFIV